MSETKKCRGCGSIESTVNPFDGWGWCWGCRDFMEEQARDWAIAEAASREEEELADMAHEAHVTLPSDWRREY